MSIKIRSATVEDLPQIQPIFEYYVLNTVVSFLVQKPPPDYIRSRYEASKERNLPYLVAEDSSSGKIVGYSYASAFRGFMLGYGHSVEMTIFCHPDYKGRGIGSRLMEEILKALHETKHISYEAGYEDKPVEFTIRNIFAIMSVDETAPQRGLALRDWYQKWGFEEVGRLKRVGFKNGRM
jgi:L-amino acid N-acyltransferase YncA